MLKEIVATRIDWVAVARIASKKSGRKYRANYCREVATGFRSSAPLESILSELGVMQDQIPSVAAVNEAVAA